MPYAGALLANGARCWWKVRVWDQTDAPSPWSAPASFTVGPLAASDWSDAQNEAGDVPYTAPYAQDAGGGPVWSGFCITMPWQIYLTYGDRRPLEQGWPVMKKWLAFIDTKMGDGLLQSPNRTYS